MAMIQELAREMLDRMEVRTRDNGERFWVLAEGAPDWMEEAKREAHGTDMMPDDYRHAYIAEALDAIATGDADADADDLRDAAAEWADNDVDVYTHDLLAWMGSNLERFAMVDGSMRELGIPHDTGLAGAIMNAQATERREVYERLIEALEKRAEEDGEDASD